MKFLNDFNGGILQALAWKLLNQDVMRRRFKSRYYYTEDELAAIKEEWLSDRARIDAEPPCGYYVDRYSEYAKYLATANLRSMFRMASHLYRHLQEAEYLFLYEGEDILITDVFRRIEANGYFVKSKIEEKEVRAHIGKISSRQTYRRFFCKYK